MRHIVLILGLVCGQFAFGSFEQATSAQENGNQSVAPVIVPLVLADSEKTVKLPEVVDDVVVGGGGRYLLYHFKAIKKIGVFDVNQVEITHYIATPDADSKFAAGLKKLVVVNSDGSLISRYDIATGERELTTSIELNGIPSSVLMGSETNGPVVIAGGSDFRSQPVEVDLMTLKKSNFQTNGNSGHGFRNTARISANGKTITNWGTSGSPSGLQTFLKVGSDWRAYYEHTSVGAILPSADGKFLFTNSGQFNSKLQRVGERKTNSYDTPVTYQIPAVHGNFSLFVTAPSRRSRSSRKSTEQAVCGLRMRGISWNLATIEGLNPKVREEDAWGREKMSIEKRLIFVPRANLIVSLAASGMELNVKSFDVTKALRESDAEFLFVDSQPAAEVKAGQQFRYQVKGVTSGADISYKLDSGPKGMTMDSNGLLTWNPTEASPQSNSVIISLTDDKEQSVFHTFDLKVNGGKGRASISGSVTEYSEKTEDIASQAPLSTELPEKKLDLPGTVSQMVVGANGRLILLHFKDLKKVGVFDVGEAKIVKYIPASDDQTLIAAGANHMLVVSQDQGVISRYNLTTFERELTKSIPFAGLIKYIGMGANSFGPAMVRWSQGSGQIDSAKFEFIDLKTLGKLDVTWPNNRRPHSVVRDRNDIHVTNDGKLFCVGGIGLIKLAGNKVEMPRGQYDSHTGGHLIPSATGRYLVSGTRIFNQKLIATNGQSQNYGLIIPSVTGEYYLYFAERGMRGGFGGEGLGGGHSQAKTPAKLYLFGDSRPLVNVPDLETPVTSGMNQLDFFRAEKKCLFMPESKVIVSLSPTLDSLILRRLDIEEALAESGIDYLIVTSMAPANAQLGVNYEYQMDVKSKKGGVKFRLDSAPDGMVISEGGKISWIPPKDLQEAEQNVIVTIRDSAGQEVFHSFSIEIPEVVAMIAERKRIAAEEERKRAIAERRERQKREIAALEEKAALHRQQVKDALAKGKTRSQPSFVEEKMEEWVDATGQHKLVARFVRVEKEENVILVDPSGKEKSVPLYKLSGKAIYRAVQLDLNRRGLMGTPNSKASPFEDVRSSNSSGLSPETLRELIPSVERMIEVAKSEKDFEAFLKGVVHPEYLKKMKARKEGFEQFKSQFEKEGGAEILSGLLQINFNTCAMMSDGIIQFRPPRGPRLRLKRYEGKWYLTDE